MATTTTERDYYDLVGVARDVDDKAIKDAFGDPASSTTRSEHGARPEPRFKEIADAYAVLSDPRKRADYGSRGFAGASGFSPEDLFAGVDLDDLFAPFGIGGSLFDRLFQPRGRRSFHGDAASNSWPPSPRHRPDRR